MCILFIAVGRHWRYPLIIAANRDEAHARASAPMERWADAPGVLAGRDGRAGGTWFGVNSSGRIAAVANRRSGRPAARTTETASEISAGAAGDTKAEINTFAAEANADTDAKTAARSRGELTARFLREEDTPEDYAEFLRAAHREFRPFNLVYGDLTRLYCFAGGAAESRPRPRLLGGGFHAISNGAPGDSWPKMSRGVALLKQRIAAGRALHSDDLAQMMRDQTRAGPAGDARSSIFVAGAHYGTRATTLLFAARGRYDLWEVNYAPNAAETGRRHFSWAVDGADKGKNKG